MPNAAAYDKLNKLNRSVPVCWNWQTRRTQNPLPATACGFKSHHRHQKPDTGFDTMRIEAGVRFFSFCCRIIQMNNCSTNRDLTRCKNDDSNNSCSGYIVLLVFWVYLHIQIRKIHFSRWHGHKKRRICYVMLIQHWMYNLLGSTFSWKMVAFGRIAFLVHRSVFLPLVLYNFRCLGEEAERI